MGTLTKNLPTTIPKKTNALAKKAKGFVELLGRSNFSFLQGASSPEEMVEQAIRLNYNGISICDLNGLYGVVRGFQTAESPSQFTASVQAATNFKYIIGTELTLTDESSIVLVPMKKQGYSHLCEILTLGKRQATKGFSKISLEQIKPYNEDLLCFALPPYTAEKFETLSKIFDNRLYLPIWRDLTWESYEQCKQAFALEEKFQAQLFVSQRPFMHSAERKPLFDVVTCIHHHTTLENAKNILIQNAERHLKPLEEISYLWQDRLDLVDKTVEIAAQINFRLDEIRYRYPSSQLPEKATPSEHLRKLTFEGAFKKFPQGIPDKVLESIEKELSLIKELEFEDYFLTLKEICDFAKRKNILHQGRGSAANSVVCFCIGLTSVDPTKIDLLFERFISRERREPPDIDIDFEHSRREEVIQHIYEKYNERHAAMVCTVIRYRSKMALRECAKVFGIPLDKINAMVKFMGRDGISRLLTPEAGRHFGFEADQWNLFLALTQQLRGFPRHLGIHSGGFLITHDPIIEMVPVEKATMNGRYVIQWNKDDVDFLKLMKIDVLSLGMLTCLRKCFDLLKEHKHETLDLASIPPDHDGTYAMIGRAETVGVFQIESRAQMNTLPRMKPKNFYDLVIEVALVRPGPLQGGMVHPFLKRRKEKEENREVKIDYAHEKLRPILERTSGVPIFQEQVMKIVIAVANFTPGEADELRRIMSSAWRKQSTMDGIRKRIMDGFASNGISPTYAEQIYKTIEGFANYGFPESHAASFALLTYASCFLKHKHPEVFVTGLLNSQPMGFYAPRTLIAEAQKNGVKFLNMSVQESGYDYTLEGPYNNLSVRVGLRSIYGIPSALLERIESSRKTSGPFLDLADFIRRTEVPRAILLKLAAAGAFTCFNTNVRELIWHLESLSLDQESFLWGRPKEQFTDAEDEKEHLPFESNWDSLRREYDTKGYSVNAHPLSVLRSYLREKNETLKEQKYVPYFCSEDLKQMKNRSKVRLAGLVAITQRPPTAKGMCFISLEDEFGIMNIVIHPPIYQKDRATIYGKSLLEIHGEIEKTGDIINVRADRVLPLT